MSSIFSLPLPAYQQPVKQSHGQKSWTRKRKRAARDPRNIGLQDATAADLDSFPEPQLPTSSPSLEYTAVLTPEERTQYRVAGQQFDQDPPPFPFPHSAARKDGRTSSDTFPRPSRPQPALTLHLQHLSVITAILHRCLAEHDYARASRAFGLILRDSLGGHPIDIRNEGRWGIGAEILLKIATRQDRLPEHANVDGKLSQQAPLFTREGFERAKRYYECLIIQYPFNKAYTASVNALDFYQALFGLWIYVVHEEGKTESESSPRATPTFLQQRELQGAREIATRLEACMSSVPFSDDLELIRLSGMVAAWIADLAEACSTQIIHASDGDAMSTDSSPVDHIAAGENQIAFEGSQKRDLRIEATRARRVAQQMFSRLQADSTQEKRPD